MSTQANGQVLTTVKQHIPALDGLRSLAIIGVIGFHLRPQILQGGFLGVTLFLVLAGYLSTISLIRLIEREHKLKYRNYIWSRIKRIYPSILGFIAIFTPLIWLCAPSLLPKLSRDIPPSLTFLTNIAYIARKVNYFDQTGLPSPLQHFWYLGVIMQAFVCWPLFLWLILRYLKTPKSRITATVTLTGFSMVASIVFATLNANVATPSRVYYALDTRASEFLVGAIVAMIQVWHSKPSLLIQRNRPVYLTVLLTLCERIMTVVLPILALATLCLWQFIEPFGTQILLTLGGYTIVAVLFATLVYQCAQNNSNTICVKIFSLEPLVYLGKRSFALYIVHFPLLEIFNPANRTLAAPFWEQCLQVAVIVLIAEGFYRLFEMPIVQRQVSLTLQSNNTDNSNQTDTTNVTVNEDMHHNDMHDKDILVASKNLHGALNARRVLICLCAIVGIIMALYPMNWQQIAYQRAIQLRPELSTGTMRPPSSSHTSTVDTKPNKHQKSHAQQRIMQRATVPTPSPYRILNPIAEKVPSNMRTSGWSIDEKSNTCSADFTMVGDSVTKGAEPYLQRAFPHAIIDGKVSRQLYEGADVYTQLRNQGRGGTVVIYALGTNGVVNNSEILQNLVNIAQQRPVYFLTLRVPRQWQDPNNAFLRQFAAQHPNVGLIDWYGLSQGHNEYLADDGIHLTPLGGPQYAHMIRLAICGG